MKRLDVQNNEKYRLVQRDKTEAPLIIANRGFSESDDTSDLLSLSAACKLLACGTLDGVVLLKTTDIHQQLDNKQQTPVQLHKSGTILTTYQQPSIVRFSDGKYLAVASKSALEVFVVGTQPRLLNRVDFGSDVKGLAWCEDSNGTTICVLDSASVLTVHTVDDERVSPPQKTITDVSTVNSDKSIVILTKKNGDLEVHTCLLQNLVPTRSQLGTNFSSFQWIPNKDLLFIQNTPNRPPTTLLVPLSSGWPGYQVEANRILDCCTLAPSSTQSIERRLYTAYLEQWKIAVVGASDSDQLNILTIVQPKSEGWGRFPDPIYTQLETSVSVPSNPIGMAADYSCTTTDGTLVYVLTRDCVLRVFEVCEAAPNVNESEHLANTFGFYSGTASTQSVEQPTATNTFSFASNLEGANVSMNTIQQSFAPVSFSFGEPTKTSYTTFSFGGSKTNIFSNENSPSTFSFGTLQVNREQQNNDSSKEKLSPQEAVFCQEVVDQAKQMIDKRYDMEQQLK